MLRGLEIRNIVLIERLDLAFRDGLNVLTGETGAGKSILLDALGFALGRRGRHAMIRTGAAEGSVTAIFELDDGHPAQALLAELGLEALPGELILRRVQAAGGPARGFVNDRRTTAEALARIGSALVEVHGQHDERGLLNPRAHRAMLDAYGGLGPRVAEAGSLWAAAQAAEAALAAARETLARAAEDADYLRHSVEELEALAPRAGEDDALDAERRRIRSAGRIREELERAAGLIAGQGAEGAMAEALSRLAPLGDDHGDLVAEPVAALDRAMVELGEAQRGLEAALEALTVDPNRLEAVEERLFAIRALARKHGVQADALPDLAADMAARLDAIDHGAEHIAGLEAEAGEARAAFDAAAAALGEARREAAARLDTAIMAELAPLRMEAARFVTEIAPAPPGPEGADRVQFTAATNPGSPPGPVDKVASGGELSRFLLAMKVCLAARAPGLTLIFDEIDRGVGGATANAVGRRLARLAETAQVLVVTHSPQVAALGAHHWHIAKRSDGATTVTGVEALDPAARLDEIARMLAGAEITAEARAAARALLEAAE
ncbi:DNA repair protein RecN [Paralimibaculum aggregatum]|uniref:DNA repair protein RecN n=1 Tax=Paralimibaculum aggregatum TaxID=3036245 RepID=A0ABQ6LJ32_9RHOB|nr:DNA repair protein RecN [Limibaculum sp. NKW23]GMG83282.1 DNA repair protein RecN [Limibaculum sp. NKW23]